MPDAPNKTLDKLWNDYGSRVLPVNVGPVQVAETKRAFYAGAYSILTAMMDQVGDEEDATDTEVNMVGDFFTEAEKFLASQLKAPSA